MADWIGQHPESSLEQATFQANEYLRRFGWPFTFDIGDVPYPGNERVMADLDPIPAHFPNSRIDPFYVLDPSSGMTIALRIEVPQPGLHITGNGIVDAPIVGITGRTIDLVTHAGLRRVSLPPAFSMGELTILDAAGSQVLDKWPMEFNEGPPSAISHDAAKVYFCVQIPLSLDYPGHSTRISDWWTRVAGESYAVRLFGQRVNKPYLVLALSREGHFSFDLAFDEVATQKVEWVSESAPTDDLVYWRFVFDDGLVYVMGWPGIIT